MGADEGKVNAERMVLLDDHDESVGAVAETSGRRPSCFQGVKEVLVEVHGFGVSGGGFQRL